MTFKKGEEVFVIQIPVHHYLYCFEVVEIRGDLIEDIDTGYHKRNVFKTRNEAINEIIKRLESLKQ